MEIVIPQLDDEEEQGWWKEREEIHDGGVER